MNKSYYVNYTDGTKYDKYEFDKGLFNECLKRTEHERFLVFKFFDKPVREIEIEHKIFYYYNQNYFNETIINKILEIMRQEPNNQTPSLSSSDED